MFIEQVTQRRRSPWKIAAIVATAALGVTALSIGGWLITTAMLGGERPTNPTAEDPRDAVGGVAPTAAVLPDCAEVFAAGKLIDKDVAGVGCLDPDGGIQVVGSFRCADGSRLYSVKPSTGAKRGWGFSGDVFHEVTGEVAADPNYAAAYRKCVG